MKDVKKGRHVPKYGNRKLVYGKGLLDIDFSCKIDAITAKAYIKEVADNYYNKGLITKRVHDALYNWTIEITD